MAPPPPATAADPAPAPAAEIGTQDAALARRTIDLLAFAAFASMASMRLCDAMLPRMAADFATTTGNAAHAVSGFAIAYGLLQMVHGWAAERVGKFRVITFAVIASSIGSLGAALAPSLGWLVAFRALAGATAAGIIPMSMAWVGDNVPYEQRQTTLARFLFGTISGLIGGQVIGGICADTVGWRYAFGLLALCFVLVGGFLLAAEARSSSLERRAQAAAGTGRASFSAQIAGVLREPWARVVLLTVMTEGAAGFAPLAFIPSYLHQTFGMSLYGAGFVLALFGVGGLFYAGVARRLILRFGEQGLALWGGLAAGLSYAALLLPAWFASLPACAFAGLGLYMLHNTLQTNATQMAPKVRSMAVALFATALFIGQSLGVTVGAQILDRAGAAWIFLPAGLGLAVIGALLARGIRLRRASRAA